jgi:hypothetical protein
MPIWTEVAVSINPSVGVRVEVDDRKRRTVALGVGLEQRVADEVIAAEGHQHHSCVDDLICVSRDGRGHLGGFREIKGQVAVIDDCHLGDGMKVPTVDEPLVGKQRRRRADAARSKAGAGAIGRRRVERHADDRDVDSLEIFAIGASEKARDARIGHVLGKAVQIRFCDGAVARVFVALFFGLFTHLVSRSGFPGFGAALPLL